MHATSIKPVGVGLVFSALICAGFCHRKERERNGRGQQSCDIDYEEEKNSKQQNNIYVRLDVIFWTLNLLLRGDTDCKVSKEAKAAH